MAKSPPLPENESQVASEALPFAEETNSANLPFSAADGNFQFDTGAQSQLDYSPSKLPRFPGAANPNVRVTPEDLLDSEPITQDYAPWSAYGQWWSSVWSRNRPIFSYWTIREMLTDPRIVLGLWLLKGPILSLLPKKVQINCSDSKVTAYIEKQIKRFICTSAYRVMKSFEWGYCPVETLSRYSETDGCLHFDTVRDIEPLDTRPVLNQGQLCGFVLRNTTSTIQTPINPEKISSEVKTKNNAERYVGFPKAIYHLHDRSKNPYFGLSRLYGAHVPWWEIWSEDGYRMIRRLWFLRNSFEGGTIYHPPGQIATPNGPRACRDYARELLEKKRAGGVMTLPNTPGPDGSGKMWEYVPPGGNSVPTGLLEYGGELRSELFEALGIPPEVIESQGDTGFGSASGRQVPQMAYFSVLQDLANWLVSDFDTQYLRYAVTMNFSSVEYDLEIESFMEDSVSAHPNDPNNGNALSLIDDEATMTNPEDEEAVEEVGTNAE